MKCFLCPNNCGVDRTLTVGKCSVGENAVISKYYLHKFEEPIIGGENGSGCVFFCGCSLKCVYCQNYSLSRAETGKEISVKELADIFRFLEDEGANNIDLVTPTHYSNVIMKALDLYKPNIPIIYNTHGYENLECLEKIDDYVDVYLPDLKFFSPKVSERYTGKKDYFEKASAAIDFMLKKPIVFGSDGLLKSGTLVRHLVLPQNVPDSKKILDWWTERKDKGFINVMSQYTPFGDIDKYPELKRKLTPREYDTVIDYAESLGIEKMFYQDLKSADSQYIPEWDF